MQLYCAKLVKRSIEKSLSSKPILSGEVYPPPSNVRSNQRKSGAKLVTELSGNTSVQSFSHSLLHHHCHWNSTIISAQPFYFSPRAWPNELYLKGVKNKLQKLEDALRDTGETGDTGDTGNRGHRSHRGDRANRANTKDTGGTVETELIMSPLNETFFREGVKKTSILQSG